MMIPLRLSRELSNSATPSSTRPRAAGLSLWAVGLLGVLACKGSIDNNEQSYSLAPAGRGTGNNAAAGNGTAPAARSPAGATSGSGSEQVGDNISGLDSESASDARSSGGSRRRAAARDRDDEDEEVDAGLEEPVEDAGVEDAGVVDGGVNQDGGVAADAGAAP